MPKLKKDLYSMVNHKKCLGLAGDEITIIRKTEFGAIIHVLRTNERCSATSEYIDEEQQKTDEEDSAASIAPIALPDPPALKEKPSKKKHTQRRQGGLFE